MKNSWYPAVKREKEVVFRRVFVPEIVKLEDGKTVVERGNYVVQEGDGKREYTPEEFERKFKVK